MKKTISGAVVQIEVVSGRKVITIDGVFFAYASTNNKNSAIFANVKKWLAGSVSFINCSIFEKV